MSCNLIAASLNRTIQKGYARSNSMGLILTRLVSGCKKEEEKKECYYISKLAPPVCRSEEAVVKEDCTKVENIRFDWLFYRPSDKAGRKYQRTWAECLESPKVIRRCVPEKPSYEKRVRRSQASKVEAQTKCATENPVKEKPKDPKACPYIKNDGCRKGRQPPDCVKIRHAADCTKYCCPYPSFSECFKDKVCREPFRAPECYCAGVTELCLMNREFQKRRSGK